MIDRAHQDASFESDVVLTGLVPQLTTPSRDHCGLVDIWFEVRWRERSTEWGDSFARLANEWRPDPRSPSVFGLFSYAANSALIVARRVNPDETVWQQVEEQARLLVARVNREGDTQRPLPPSSQSEVARGWTMRVRGATSGLRASLRWMGEPKNALPSVAPKMPIPSSQTSR